MEELMAGGADEETAMAEANRTPSMGSFVMKFGEVFVQLPSLLPECMVEELTEGIAYSALWSLTYEIRLKITRVGSDIFDTTIEMRDQ
jgi:hypothetical protein